MAYSDYGGYAYRNGERVPERSDAVLSPSGIKSTPGAWPGWTIEEGRNGGSYHVILGDGPIFVGLYKQSSLTICRCMDEVPLLDCAIELPEGAIWEALDETRYLNEDHFKTTEEIARFEVDGHVIEAAFRIEDNHYQYVRLTQPDGTVWTGFSGYGVGAGFEDDSYGFSTSEREQLLREVFPASARTPFDGVTGYDIGRRHQ